MTLTTRVQSAAVAAVLCCVGWAGYMVLAQMQFDGRLAAKDREIVGAKAAYGDLKGELAKTESRFQSLARTLEAKHAYLMALLDRPSDAADAPKAGTGSEEDPSRRRIESSRRALLAQLSALESVLAGGDTRSKGNVAGAVMPDADRARLRAEHKRLVGRIDKLEERLFALNGAQRGVMNYLAAQSIDDFDRAKKLVAITGLDIDDLLARVAGQNALLGRGGPFVAAAPDSANVLQVPAALGVIDHQLDRWETLGLLIGRLPLVAPTRHYYVASRYGKRRDPINRRWAMHYGLDLAGVHRSPILATAPGIVVKAGWSGHYGRTVEIDHGLGIRTRYGHLRRITVKRGQKVGFRQKIGEMGNSGRSTGTHVHYEILVNGRPRNPEKFMEAGKHVLEGH